MSSSDVPYSAVAVWRVALSARFEQRVLSLRKLEGIIQYQAGNTYFFLLLGGAQTAIVEGEHPAPNTWVEVDVAELRKLMFAEGEPECVFFVSGDYALYEQAFQILSRPEEKGRSWLDVRTKS